MRREYEIGPLVINNRVIQRLIIDPHVDRHADHIDDDLIKQIVRRLHGGAYRPVKQEDGFSYFATKVEISERWYKLIWLLEKDFLYIGVITVFKDRRIK